MFNNSIKDRLARFVTRISIALLIILITSFPSRALQVQAASTSIGDCQCTDYVYSQRPDIPRGPIPMGNANNWVNSARNRGYSYDQTPSVGDVVVFLNGVYKTSLELGHVAMVTWVNSSHTQFNAVGWDGLIRNCALSPMNLLSVNSNTWFIHSTNSNPIQNPPQPPAPQPSSGNLSFNPVSPVQVGQIVTISVTINPGNDFRAARLLIDYHVLSESSATTFSYSWNTSGLLPSVHNIRLEIASRNDTNWAYPNSYETTYLLREAPQSSNRSPNIPTILSPLDKQSLPAGNQLCWHNNGDPDGDQTTSRAEIWGAFSWIGPWLDGENPCWSLPSPITGQYTWAVRSRDSKGAESGASSAWTFIITGSPVVSPATINLIANPKSIASGGAITVSWDSLNASGNDWISMHPAGAGDGTYLDWKNTSGSSGSMTFTAPSSSGNFEFRLFRNGTKAATSNTFLVVADSNVPPTSCTAPPIEDLSFSPGSPSPIGKTVNIHAKATSNSCFRSMRLKIDGNIVNELGSPEFTYNWNTTGYSAGSHTIRLEVAAQDDNSWASPSTREATYTLQSAPPPPPPVCTAPPIEDLSFNPSSPANIGTAVNVHAKATWNSCFRAMRLKIDGNIVYELGSPEFTYNWNTTGYGSGGHTIRLEVAALGDNSWNSPSVRESIYNLSTNGGLSSPTLSSPSNGALVPPGTDVSLQWNSVSGASQYLVEIWGGQYGGTHTTPCGWQSNTSCHIGTMSPGNVLWHAKARDSGGNESPWSGEWNFTPQ